MALEDSPPSEGSTRRPNIRAIYLSSLGAIFLIANLSYYVQFPGLLSSVGVEPAAARVLPTLFPELKRHLEENDVDGDSFIESLCLVGIVLSSIAASGLIQHGSLFVALTAIYYFLTTTGGQMYSFQWDILLTEVGAITALCAAPWHKLNYVRNPNGNSIGAWPLRFLLFKLMFMSGVVKIQANCPTWLNLTALEYHFATQCLPGPLAWHAHQLHPFFLRLSVAATFVIEIPATFLLIAPVKSFRVVGAWLQILLQIVIILTGSYNFFNLLTIALCLSCFEDDSTKGATTRIFKKIQYVACTGYLAWATNDMCHFESINDQWNVKLAWNKVDTDTYINATLPWAIPLVFVFVAASSLSHLRSISERPDGIVKKSFGRMGTMLQLATCCFCIGILSIPMLDLTPQLHHGGYPGSNLFSEYWPKARQYHLSSGYGLFRRMTGVGKASGTGWAGLTTPSVVARPEIIVEAKLQDKDGGSTSDWKELEFRWKPGDLKQMPLQVAPHQPRLDWRMWFAALGSYNHNPWFIAFLGRLLSGCPDATHLLNEPDIEAGKKRIVSIRSNLYAYDFTRIDSDWSRTIPGVTILKDGKVPSRQDQEVGNETHLTRLGWWEDMSTLPKQYWSRNFVKEYTPVMRAGDSSVSEFLKRTGFESTCVGRYIDRCSLPAKGGHPLHPLCSVTVLIRQRHLIWLPVLFLALVWRWRLGALFKGEYYHWYSQRGGILVIGPPKNERVDDSVQKKEQ